MDATPQDTIMTVRSWQITGSHLTLMASIASTHSSFLHTGHIAAPGDRDCVNPQLAHAYNPSLMISLVFLSYKRGFSGRPGRTSLSEKKYTLIFPEGSRKAYFTCPRCSIAFNLSSEKNSSCAISWLLYFNEKTPRSIRSSVDPSSI